MNNCLFNLIIMKYKTLFALLAGATVCIHAAESAYRYDDYSAGRSFFSDGQEWVFIRNSSDGGEGFRIKATVTGDTVISSYMDYYGQTVRVDQPCKAISVVSDDPSRARRSFAAYEWDAEIYVYSDNAREFVMMAAFNRPENVKFLDCGEKWSVGRVDYVAPKGRMLKRYTCSAVAGDRSSVWVYRAGADRVWINESKWDEGGSLSLVSYSDPADGSVWTPEDYMADTCVPDNRFYSEGKEWIYKSAAAERRGDPDKLVHMEVGEEMLSEHMPCRMAAYHAEGEPVGHESTVCSLGDVMYERGYMGMLVPRFDFGIGQGERADSGDLSSEVAGIDYIEINGVSRKRILFKGENSASVWNYWVEGIGAPSGDGLLRRDDFDDMPDVYVPGSFVRCVEGGHTVFEAADFSVGRSSVGELNEDSPHQEKEMYTAGGMRCSGATTGSIVICRGKKYVSE